MAPADGGHANQRAGVGGGIGICDVRFHGAGYVAQRGADCFLRSIGSGFLGAGVIFKDAGSVRGLNTAATLWCSAAIGAISGLGRPLHALILGAAVLATNVVLRPLAYRLYPAQASGEEQEVTYGFELACRQADEAHMRALLLQAMSRSPLTLTALRSEDIEGTPKMKVTAQIKGLGRQDDALEQLVVRLSLEAGVSSVSWTVHPQVLE